MKIEAFTKTYGGRTVLDFPGIEIPDGKIFAVAGANGSGKSTFARILAGTEKPDIPGSPAKGVRAGYMPQKSFAFRMSLKRNLLVNSKDSAKAGALMEKLNLLPLADCPAKRLSGGETAKMALARLLMGDYRLLILDEPTAAMDMESTLLAERLIREYSGSTSCPVILVTHSLQQARRISDSIMFFSKGKLIEAGETGRILNHPQKRETAEFLDFYGIEI